MISSVLSRLVILLFGTLYPAYSSYKAIRTKNIKEYVKWMMYWIVYALFTCAETFTDLFLSFWFPFYYEFKIILVVYLLSPATNGSSILYKKFVHPMLSRREEDIDECIAKAMEQSYHTMLELGSRSVAYATSVIMQTAIRGGGGLVNQIRKSYSLDDIGQRNRLKGSADEPDEAEGRAGVRRRRSPRRTMSSQVDMYFPEADQHKRSTIAIDRNVLSHIRSSEDVSSGYSSTEPLTSSSSNDHLLRTASMGPTTRTRARVLTKKTISEDESGCSATGPNESQCAYPQILPFPTDFIPPFVRPEYRYLFANLTQQQWFTFVNNANCAVGPEAVGTPPVAAVIAEAPPTSTEASPMTETTSKAAECPKMETNVEVPATTEMPASEVKEEVVESSPSVAEVEAQTTETAQKASTVLTTPQVTISGKAEAVKPEDLEDAEGKSSRSGKYHKRPAPTPPNPEDEDFSTPNPSPVSTRRNSKSVELTADEEEDPPKEAKPKKKRSKSSEISKMLHFSKIQFPFWKERSGKLSPGSEASSSRGSRASLKTDQEAFIPLRGDENPDVNVREMSQSPSSKRKSFHSST